jgi:hypothetical protein
VPAGASTSGTLSFAQLVRYTGGTPVNPPDVTQPAFAYDPNGILPSLGWNSKLKQWR